MDKRLSRKRDLLYQQYFASSLCTENSCVSCYKVKKGLKICIPTSRIIKYLKNSHGKLKLNCFIATNKATWILKD